MSQQASDLAEKVGWRDSQQASFGGRKSAMIWAGERSLRSQTERPESLNVKLAGTWESSGHLGNVTRLLSVQ